MFQLIKYELRGKLLTLMGICLVVIMGNAFLIVKNGSGGTGVAILSTFLGVGALVVIFISSLTMISDYLYTEQGYLLFTLPQSGVSIMGSRLVAAVLQISLVAAVSIVMFCFVDQGRLLQALSRNSELTDLLYSILMYLWTIVSTLTFIYFCMVVGKIALKGKMLGKIGSFIIFILLCIVKAGLTAIISNVFPQIVELNSITVIAINIGSTLADLLIFAVLFSGSAYLLEHRINL